MTDGRLLYFHAPCFDGLVSAVLAWDFLEQRAGWTRVRPRGVNYGIRPWWPTLRPKAEFAVVDFLFHPRATFWADHHPTTFLTPELARGYAKRASRLLFYDESAPSCSALLWNHLASSAGHRTERFAGMVEWATKIDAARYASVDEIFDATASALTINLALSQFADPRECDRLVRTLKQGGLEALASDRTIRRRGERARRLSADGLKGFKRRAHLVAEILLFHFGR